MSRDMEILTPISVAAKRMAHLLDTGYLPSTMQADVRILMQAAMAWEVYSGQKDIDVAPSRS